MMEQAKLFVNNVEKIELYVSSHRKQWMLELAMQLTIRQRFFIVMEFENVRQIIKQRSKWYSTLRNSEKIHHSYYVHYNTDQELIQQAIARQQQLTSKSIFQAEEGFLAVVIMEDVERLEAMQQALKKQPSLRFTPLALKHTAILAKHPEEVAVIASTYEHYYTALQQLKWKIGIELRASACLLASQTGCFNKVVWERVTELTNSFQQYTKKLEKNHYLIISLLALTNFTAADFNVLEQIHAYIKEQLKLTKYDEQALLYAAQLYTLVEAPHLEIVDTMDFVDLLVDVAGFADSDSSGGDGGSSGGGD